MTKYRDITGQRWGRLVALRIHSVRPTRWLFKCDCGEECAVLLGQLKSGKTKSCGCIRRETVKLARKNHSGPEWLLQNARQRIEERSIPEPNTGCWLWTGALNNKGYGHAGYGNRKTISASRLSYIAFIGDPGELNVLHKCDTPSCVNPDHLFVGTQHENIKDCIAKGRFRPGGVLQPKKSARVAPPRA